MSSNSITMKSASRPARGAAFLLAVLWATIVLIAVVIVWAVCFVLFLPLLVLTTVLRRRTLNQQTSAPGASIDVVKTESLSGVKDAELIFDRRSDVSKLFGCNTRNVEYRWHLFSSRLREIKDRASAPRALDFGAGSLRDSYELVREGFHVTSMDLDPAVMQHYFNSYDWSAATSTPEVFTNSIQKLSDKVGHDYFDLMIAFDVLEHLECPEQYLQHMRPLLRDEGYLFAIVPNRRSIFERYFKYSLKKQREKGLTWTPGVPHLQFRSPEEWDRFFAANGFSIVEHDMAIGSVVNDLWHGAFGLPIRVFVAPALHRVAHQLRLNFNPSKFEEAFFPPSLMTAADLLDSLLKPHTRNRFGWNLIVARRKV
jgi:2-polyprenyl-3-methyl-5-hydroxy-6-metoxy-1,4-benzoquinol methylase